MTRLREAPAGCVAMVGILHKIATNWPEWLKRDVRSKAKGQAVAPPMQQPVVYQPLAQGGLAAASEGVGLPALRLLNDIVSNLAAPKGAVDQNDSGAKGQPGKGNFGKGKRNKNKKKQSNQTGQGTSSEVGRAPASAPTQPNQPNKEQGNFV